MTLITDPSWIQLHTVVTSGFDSAVDKRSPSVLTWHMLTYADVLPPCEIGTEKEQPKNLDFWYVKKFIYTSLPACMMQQIEARIRICRRGGGEQKRKSKRHVPEVVALAPQLLFLAFHLYS
jgi:hypothetical protein